MQLVHLKTNSIDKRGNVNGSADIYSRKMKKLINKKLVRLYGWIAICYFLLGTFGIAGYFPGKFLFI
ncbi:MAG: hypothetical protein WCF67_15285, partial [Chitinophagaceae bacterium]